MFVLLFEVGSQNIHAGARDHERDGETGDGIDERCAEAGAPALAIVAVGL